MKFTICFKTPDALEYALNDLIEFMEPETEKELEEFKNEFENDLKEWRNHRKEHAKEYASQYIEYNEYINIEFDTEAKTVKVLPVK